jgi:hypothetical protein
MMKPMIASRDEQYLALLLKRIEVCKNYRPKFGQSEKIGLSLQQFQHLYGADLFYAWFGLDDPLVYAAHRAAGGITSIYRQIGIGVEELFRRILRDELGLDSFQATWSYSVKTSSGQDRVLKLDGRISLADISSEVKHIVITNWLNTSAVQLQIAPEIMNAFKGAVFEVRQGYKSKDSKRQNADIANAASAYTQGYLPVVMIFSNQIDRDVALRYTTARWLVLRGTDEINPTVSAYAFMRNVIGYDLAAFFQTYSSILKSTVADVLKTLLSRDE